MRFTLPSSFAPDGSNVLFVEEAAEAWASVLLREAEKVATTTPNKTGLTPNRSFHNHNQTNTTIKQQQQLLIDLSGAILPGSTVEFLCETVIPHFFEVAFTSATTSSNTSTSITTTAVFPTLTLHLRSCELSHDSAVKVFNAISECLEVFSNTFGSFLQQKQQSKFPVLLDLGFNKELNDKTVKEFLNTLSPSYQETQDPTSSPVMMVFDLGLAGCGLSNSGFSELLSIETDDLLSGLNLVDCSGIQFLEGNIEEENNDKKRFLPFVLDRLLTHKSLRCITLSECAFGSGGPVNQEQQKLELVEKFILAGRTNIFLTAVANNRGLFDDDEEEETQSSHRRQGCQVIVCTSDGKVLNPTDDSNIADRVSSPAPSSGITVLTPVKILKEPLSREGGVEEALEQERAENAALRAEIEALKAAKKKKKKTGVKNTKRVAPVPIICANSLNADVCVVTSCDKENAVTTSRKKPSTLLGAHSVATSARSRSTNGAIRSSSTTTIGSSASGTSSLGGRQHRSASTTSTACSAVRRGGGSHANSGSGCHDCVKLRRALHTHGANSMPTSTLKIQQGPLSSSKTNNHQGNALGPRPALADRPMWY